MFLNVSKLQLSPSRSPPLLCLLVLLVVSSTVSEKDQVTANPLTWLNTTQASYSTAGENATVKDSSENSSTKVAVNFSSISVVPKLKASLIPPNRLEGEKGSAIVSSSNQLPVSSAVLSSTTTGSPAMAAHTGSVTSTASITTVHTTPVLVTSATTTTTLTAKTTVVPHKTTKKPLSTTNTATTTSTITTTPKTTLSRASTARSVTTNKYINKSTSAAAMPQPNATSTEAPAVQTTSLPTGPATRTFISTTSAESTTNHNELEDPGTRVPVIEVAGAALTRQLVDTASLLAVLLFGLLFFLVTVAVFVTQAYESYKRRDYTQVDYLINGMYADSGV